MKFLEKKRQKQKALIIAGLIGAVVLFGLLLYKNRTPQTPIKEEAQNVWSESGEGELWKKKWMVEAQSEIEAQREKLKVLQQKQEKTQKTLEEILKTLNELKQQQQMVKTSPMSTENNNLNLERPKKSLITKPSQMEEEFAKPQVYIPPPKNFKPEILNNVLVVKTVEKKEKEVETQRIEEKKEKISPIVLPPGSFVKAVLLSGVDAPTIGEGVAKEYPVLIQILDKAFLPNDWKEDIKKCFAVGWARGDLASERAYIRIDRMSCIAKDGTIWVAKGGNFGAVYGEDGKVGLLGRVVAKEGTLLARALIAGFLQGVGQILQQSATVVNVSPVGGTTTSTLQPSQTAKVGLFAGASKAAELLAKEYERLIKLTFPVIEIPAGRKVDIVFYEIPQFKKLCVKSCEKGGS